MPPSSAAPSGSIASKRLRRRARAHASCRAMRPSQVRKRRAPGELVQVRVRAHPRLLGDVLRLGVAAKDHARQPVDALVVPAHEDLEKVDLARTNSPDDLLV